MLFRLPVHPLFDTDIYKYEDEFDKCDGCYNYKQVYHPPPEWTAEQVEAAYRIGDWLDSRIQTVIKKLLGPVWSKNERPQFLDMIAVERAIVRLDKYPYLRDKYKDELYKNLFSSRSKRKAADYAYAIHNTENIYKEAALKISKFLAPRYKKGGWDLNADRQIVKRNIESILQKKCGNNGPTGDMDNDWDWDDYMRPIKPFTYDTKQDIVYMTSWECRLYSIDYCTIPTLAGITLWNRNSLFEGHNIRLCDYRGRGAVMVYESVKNVRKLLSWRIRQFLRRCIYKMRRPKVCAILANLVGDDVAQYVIMPFLK